MLHLESQTLRLADCHTQPLRLSDSDSQSVKLSDSRTITCSYRLSGSQILRLPHVPAFRPSNSQTFSPLDWQNVLHSPTLVFSHSYTPRLSDHQTRRLAGSPTPRLSDIHTLGLSDSPALNLLNSQTRSVSDSQTFLHCPTVVVSQSHSLHTQTRCLADASTLSLAVSIRCFSDSRALKLQCS